MKLLMAVVVENLTLLKVDVPSMIINFKNQGCFKKYFVI